MTKKIAMRLGSILLSILLLLVYTPIPPVSATPLPDTAILGDNFQDHGDADTVMSTTLAPIWSAINNAAGTNNGVQIATDPHDANNKVVKLWYNNSAAAMSLTKTMPDASTDKFVVSGRVMVTSVPPVDCSVRMSIGSKYQDLFSIRASDGQIRPGGVYVNNFGVARPNEWISFVCIVQINSTNLNGTTNTVYISGGTASSYAASTPANKTLKISTTLNLDGANAATAPTIAFRFTGNATTSAAAYYDDIKIYRATHFTMTPSKTTHVGLSESVDVAFNHAVDMLSFKAAGANAVKVAVDGGAPINANVTYDERFPEKLALTFPNGLSADTNYTITLDPSITDVLGNTINDVARFSTSGGAPPVYDVIEAVSVTPIAPVIQQTGSTQDVVFTANTTPATNVDTGKIQWWVGGNMVATGKTYTYTPIDEVGDQTITAKCADDPEIQSSGTVRVVNVIPVAVTGVSVMPTELTLWQDYPLDLTPRATITPSDATNKAVTWTSGDQTVATVDPITGSISMLSPGVTNITATAADGGFTASMALTVTEPQNRTVNDKLNLDPVTSGNPRISTNDFVGWPAVEGQGKIALWSGNKTVAYTITVDDSISEDFYKWNAWKNGQKPGDNLSTDKYPHAYGFPATFFVPVQNFVPGDSTGKTYLNNASYWKTQVSAGQSIQSHSRYHIEGETKNSTFTTAMHVDDCLSAIGIIDDAVNMPANNVRTMAAAWGGGKQEIWRQFYIAVRGSATGINPPGTTNYNNISSFSMNGTRTPTQMSGMVTNALNPLNSSYGSWLCLHSHGLDYTLGKNTELQAYYQTASDQFMTSDIMAYTLDQILYPNRDKIWGATFDQAAMYGQERDTATLTVTQSTPQIIKYTLTDQMDNKMFDFPLTVKFKVPAVWNDIEALQGTEQTSLPLVVVEESGNKYVMVETIPDRGEVTLKQSSIDDASDATLAALTYRIGTSASLAIDGFMPSDQGGTYNVSLPAGTTSVVVEPTVANSNATVTTPADGVVDVSSGSGSIVLSVESQDAANTYVFTINFTVRGYTPITSLTINTPSNLNQSGNAQAVTFSVTPDPPQDIDTSSIEWFINGQIQTGASGIQFVYTPPTPGSYDVYAKSVDVCSEVKTIVYSEIVIVADNEFLFDDFDGYATGQQVPTGIGQKWVGGGAAFTTVTDAFYSTMGNMGKIYQTASGTVNLTKTVAMDSQPLAVSGKIRIDAPRSGDTSDSTNQRHNISLQLISTATATPFQFAHNGNTVVGSGASAYASPSWKKGKWMSFVFYIEPNGDDLANSPITEFIGGEYDGTATKRSGVTNLSTLASLATADVRLSFKSPVPTIADPASPIYIDDIRIYRPGTFTMAAKTPIGQEVDAPVTISFSHHMDRSTLTADKVKVKDGDTTVAVESITIDSMNPDKFIINFATDALEANTTYTVTLSEDVLDIAGNPVIGNTQFTTAGNATISLNYTQLTLPEYLIGGPIKVSIDGVQVKTGFSVVSSDHGIIDWDAANNKIITGTKGSATLTFTNNADGTVAVFRAVVVPNTDVVDVVVTNGVLNSFALTPQDTAKGTIVITADPDEQYVAFKTTPNTQAVVSILGTPDPDITITAAGHIMILNNKSQTKSFTLRYEYGGEAKDYAVSVTLNGESNLSSPTTLNTARISNAIAASPYGVFEITGTTISLIAAKATNAKTGLPATQTSVAFGTNLGLDTKWGNDGEWTLVSGTVYQWSKDVHVSLNTKNGFITVKNPLTKNPSFTISINGTDYTINVDFGIDSSIETITSLRVPASGSAKDTKAVSGASVIYESSSYSVAFTTNLGAIAQWSVVGYGDICITGEGASVVLPQGIDTYYNYKNGYVTIKRPENGTSSTFEYVVTLDGGEQLPLSVTVNWMPADY